MNKNEMIWIVIRFIGLFFIFNALLLLPIVLSYLGWLLHLGPDFNATVGTSISSKVTEANLIGVSLKLLLNGLLGFYLLKRGRWVFNLIKIPSNPSNK